MALSNRKLEEIFKGIHAGRISIENLPFELSKFTFDEIMAFVVEGFGGLDTEFKTTKMGLYENNITAFSGAKNFQMVKDINSFVFDETGAKRKFSEFRDFAFSIDDQYNKVWLKTEQDTAFGVAQSADQWADIEEDKELFPLLKYQTAGDERVRDSHAQWDNIVRPVDDSFWDINMPINGFNCRCQVIKLESGKVSSLKGVKNNEDPLFNVNPGKVNYIFNEEKHPYFQHTKSEGMAFEKALRWRSGE